MSVAEVPQLVKQLYDLVGELEELFPGRKFTLDGHLVGSIGEVLAAHHYDLRLLAHSAERHDAEASDGRQVQVKATQTHRVSLRSEPEWLLVLSLNRDGSFNEVYNGPGSAAWQNCGKRQKNGQRQISLSRLTELMSQVPEEEVLPRVADTLIAES